MSAESLILFASLTEVIPHLEGVAKLCPVIIALPLLSFLLISFLSRKNGEVSSFIAVFSLFSAFVASLFMAIPRFAVPEGPIFEIKRIWLSVGSPQLASINVGLLVDNLSATTSVMVTFIATLVGIYSQGYMSKEIGHFPTQTTQSLSRFYAYLSLFVFSMLGLVFSNNLLQIYIFWELVGLCSYLLIGFWYFKKSAADANKKSFVVTKFADLFFLIGILSVGLGAGTFNLLELDRITGVLPFALLGTSALPLICIAFGPIGKSAQFPLHVWLPDAMEGPTPVSALIHAATMVAAGIYLVGRLFNLFMLDLMAGYFVAFVGAFTALIAALIALVQNDIKKVLAYSTISQLGFMLGALGSGAYTAGLFHLFTHAFFKALLFLGSGAVIVACHSNDIWTMGGLKKHLKFTHGAFVMGCLALAGFPLFSGFWSKDEILAGAFGRYPEIFGMLCFAAFLTAFYVTRMYCIAFLGEYRGDENKGPFAGMVPSPDLPAPIACSKDTLGMEPEWTEEKADPNLNPPRCLGAKQEHVPHHHGPPHEVSSTMYGPLLVLAVFAVFLGFVGIPEHNLFHHLIQHYREPAHEFHLWLMGVSVLIALSGIGLGWSFFAKDPIAGEERLRKLLGGFHTTLSQKFYMDHFWAWAVSITMMTFSKVAAWFDDDIIDGGVRGTGVMTAVLGEKIRKEHSGLISHYLFMLIASVLLLAMLLGGINPDFVLSPQRILEFNDSFPTRGITE
ncbi:MAG TPA: NADH-quinone oxidoreductase subunit L [Phycisphaerales bacterium]|nr:NADH-quinone oxidoreductase subunit L [Phycisphaerales bacterium]